ncbi:Protein kinase domain-containing protein [Mycena indigotica]|uniref:Protein kinase domain-containing protein n=1 Tax=Mycena indigotica TaxID=2126181 RepID=A0A8H6SG73_9AGAR|nr:Protein kinase domain-containing protein [Mycena indigotica]KAF7298926.1 Protein kinase domain-containing protein [Mycena indigotica]
MQNILSSMLSSWSSSSSSSIEDDGLEDIPTAELRKDVEGVLEWNPARLRRWKTAPPLPVQPRHWRYTKHLDSKLLLRSVVPMDSLVNDLSKLAQENLDAMLGPCGLYPSRALGYHMKATAIDLEPEGIADGYERSSAEICGRIVTKVLIPKTRDWGLSVQWGRRVELHKASAGIDDGGHLFFLGNPDSGLELYRRAHLELMDPGLRTDLERVLAYAPKIGTWVFLSLTRKSKKLLLGMDQLAARGSFDYELCRTAYPNSTSSLKSVTVPPDATSTPWTLPSFPGRNNSDSGHTRTLRATTIAASKATKGRAEKVVIPSARRRPETTAYAPVPLTSESLVQLAWAKAVENDATMIVFNCGNHERLAVRHRGTQTLYISELYDTTKCAEPGYAKLHVGLYLAQVFDAIARAKAASAPTEPRRSSRKRPHNDNVAASSLPNKRSKRDPEKSVECPMMELASQCDMMLLHLQYDNYHSPSPASFLRTTPCLVHKTHRKPGYSPQIKRSYRLHECFEVILTGQLGRGGTGTVYGAKGRLTTKDGETRIQEDLIVKMAFEKHPQRRMRHEYDVYQQLAEHGVTGVPQVYGLFEDLEGGALALVMNHCGQDLWELRPDKDTSQTPVTPAQRDRFTEILQNVHRAGVRHHDIRAANLMINAAGEACIADFDRARLNSTEAKKEWEMDILREFMEGIHHNFLIPSPSMPGDEQEIRDETPVSAHAGSGSGGRGEGDSEVDSEVDSDESGEDAGEDSD